MEPGPLPDGPPPHRDAWLSCRDGVRLVSRIWSPPGEGPWPVLLMRQPYGRAIASTVTYAHPGWYASHGFLVVVQDVRGRGDSEGEFAGFAQEARDGTDTLHWVRQLPGSNGRVGCYGFSYQGLSQLLLEPDGPLPDCLAPAMAGLDERLHWASSGGAHWWALGLAWGLQLAAERCRRRGDAEGWAEIRRSLTTQTFLDNGLALLNRFDPGGMASAWLARDATTANRWRRHPVPEPLWRRPMLLTGGWHDPHLEGILDLWRQARSQGGRPLLRIGAWSHLAWQGGIDELLLDFFRCHLQKAGNPVHRDAPALDLAVPIALQDCRDGLWRSAPAVEAPRQLPRWWLGTADGVCVTSRGGRLATSAAGLSQPWVGLVHDPWRPVPGRGGHLGLDAGLCDRADLDQRQDVACFSTEPLEAACSLAGRPVLDLVVRADQPGFDLCVALSAVAANGQEVQQLCTGVLRHCGDSSLRPAIHRILLQPLSAVLQAGERLRLSLAGAAWPQVAVNPGTGELPQGPATARHRIITLWVQTATAQLSIEPFPWVEAGAN
ncbi:CocE/NonD family hydrolase [Cyanobium sp. NIES-981]|uniref:CocE/NonD family hydrolase n=1 Tax=Cyanobium sp. NIES-981 TaxID=1851505 RepID=UPI0007DD4AE7|nr:CocE/NonD family hydrolase [Cyanobium sp. NIES-981]SBO42474.1 Acyl esterase [Cyanobium sp. NIES-981]